MEDIIRIYNPTVRFQNSHPIKRYVRSLEDLFPNYFGEKTVLSLYFIQ